MRVVVSGATGFVGSHLVPFLRECGYGIGRLTRSPAEAEDIAWDPAKGTIDTAKFQPVDAVIHLAGENIADGRWTDEKKERIRKSRVEGTQVLSAVLATLPAPPNVLISASAVGYYGDRGDEILTEESRSGEGFLAEVCRQWEAATRAAVQAGIRTILLRNGIILAPDGGVLKKILLPFKFGLGGPIGGGQQYWSWISMPDFLQVVLHCLMTKELSGPVNAVTPHPVRNTEFTQALGNALNRPTLLPVPEGAVRLAVGEMADEMILASTRAIPQRLQTTGYAFTHATLENALRDLLQ